jgi:lipopolysaccharide biosynthesis glycosyltransferase
LLRTQRFDRPSLIFLIGAASDLADGVAADLARYFSKKDPRIVGLRFDETPTLHILRRKHPQLYSDILRAYLFNHFTKAILWFDADMLLVRDISTVFDYPCESTLAAAADPTA